MKASLCVVTAFVSLVAMVFGPVGSNGQDFDCLIRHPAFDQCFDSFLGVSSSPENRAAFCNGGCGQSLAQGSVDCGIAIDDYPISSIFRECMTNAEGRFCRDIFPDPQNTLQSDLVNNITAICSADNACTGACNDSLQEIGCCANQIGFNFSYIFPNCNVPACEPPFILGPPNPPPPATEGTDSPLEGPLIDCLNVKRSGLPESCREIISDQTGTSLNSIFGGINIGEFCTTSCAEMIAEVFNECETIHGSFFSLANGDQVNYTFAQALHAGCGRDNLDSSRVCVELNSDVNYLLQIQQATGDNSPCIESFTRGECLDDCREAIESLGCCIRYFALFFTGPETQVLDYCNIQSCPVPFELGGADKIHSAPIILVIMVTIIAAVVNAVPW